MCAISKIFNRNCCEEYTGSTNKEQEEVANVNVLQDESDSDSAQIEAGESGNPTMSYRESLLHRLREEHEFGYYMD